MGAPKGNKFAEGNNGGRPAIHTDPEEVSRLVDDYFKWIEGEKEEVEVTYTEKDAHGNEKEVTRKVEQWLRRPETPTVTGLTLHLGFADKSTLYDYRDKKEFSHYIKRGLLQIEKYHEIMTSAGEKCTGNIFILKNFGWSDKVEVDGNVSISPITGMTVE